MPTGTRVHNCVDDCKRRQGSATSPANCYAVCQASTHQSFATGKPTKRLKGKSLLIPSLSAVKLLRRKAKGCKGLKGGCGCSSCKGH